MGITNFTSDNSINPPFVCYKGRYINKKRNEIWPALIIKAEMFVNPQDIRITQKISDDNEFMNIIISCDKKFKKDSNIVEEIKIIDENIKEGNMEIKIKVNLNNFLIDNSKPPLIREPFPGIKFFYFKIIEKEDLFGIKTEKITKKK